MEEFWRVLAFTCGIFTLAVSLTNIAIRSRKFGLIFVSLVGSVCWFYIAFH